MKKWFIVKIGNVIVPLKGTFKHKIDETSVLMKYRFKNCIIKKSCIFDTLEDIDEFMHTYY